MATQATDIPGKRKKLDAFKLPHDDRMDALSKPEGPDPLPDPSGSVTIIDDATTKPDLTNKEKMALAAIAILTPLVGGIIGGDNGALAGGQSALDAIGKGAQERDRFWAGIEKEKFLQKSKARNAEYLAALKKKGAKDLGTDGRFDWLSVVGKNGKPTYIKVNRKTGEVFEGETLPQYVRPRLYTEPGTGNLYDPETGTYVRSQDAGKDAPARRGAEGGFKPGAEKSPRPPGVSGKLPAKTKEEQFLDFERFEKEQGLQGGQSTEARGVVAPEDAQASSGILFEQATAALEDEMPSARELDPTPIGPESVNAGKARSENARKRRDAILDTKKRVAVEKEKLDREIRKNQEKEDFQKEFAEFKNTLSKDLIKFRESFKAPKSEGGPKITAGQRPPSGYRFKDDGSLEPIPGGPADVKVSGKPTTADPYKSLPRDKQIQVDVLTRANTGRLSTVIGMEAEYGNYARSLRAAKEAKTEDERKRHLDDAVKAGQGMLKLLNSSQNPDAVGAEEAKRLGSFLEFQKGNLTGPGKFWGRDLDAFDRQVKGKIDSLRNAHAKAEAEVDRLMGRSGGDFTEAIQGNLEVQREQVVERDQKALDWVRNQEALPAGQRHPSYPSVRAKLQAKGLL